MDFPFFLLSCLTQDDLARTKGSDFNRLSHLRAAQGGLDSESFWSAQVPEPRCERADTSLFPLRIDGRIRVFESGLTGPVSQGSLAYFCK